MAASDNINRHQIPGHHIDAIRAAIEHRGSQGITFSPRSTDFTDESGKTHRVPVDRNESRIFDVDLTDPKNSSYSQFLPTEGYGLGVDVTRWGGITLGESTSRQGEPGLADSMRTAQLKEADRVDKETALAENTPMAWIGDAKEMSMRTLGDRSHIIHVNVSNDEESGHYEYDTKTGNIGPELEPDYDTWSYDKSNLSVARSEQSRLGLPGKHLRSFER